jgi:hypothetical protein
MTTQIFRFGSQTKVNTSINGDQEKSSVVGLADGGWLVTWTVKKGLHITYSDFDVLSVEIR